MKFIPIARTAALAGLLIVSHASATPLRMMTYNLQGMKPGTDPDTRIQQIIQHLQELDPDIIGLQEINESLDGHDNQARVIADSLSEHFGVEYHVYYEFTHLSWDNQFREFVGIITRLPVTAEGFGQLVPGVFPRKVVWNAIDTSLGRVNFFDTHLCFSGPDVRMMQVEQIIGFINQKQSEFPGIASILVGDFNDTPESETIQLLTNPGSGPWYIDSYAHANPGSAGFTVPASDPSSRIDYVFEKSTGSLTIGTSMVVMDEPYDGAHYCSDHLGVLTVFRSDHTGSIPRSAEPMLCLLASRPNPAAGRGAVRYLLGRDSAVLLTVHNLAGEHIRTLAGGHRSAGEQEVMWDCRDSRGVPVASAAYLLRLEADSGVAEGVITLIR